MLGITVAGPAYVAFAAGTAVSQPGTFRDFFPHVAEAPDGSRLVAVWITDENPSQRIPSVRVSTSTNGGQAWSNEVVVATAPTGTYVEWSRINYDSNGNAHIIYYTNQSNGRVYHRFLQAGANPLNANNWQDRGTLCSNCKQPDIDSDDKGNVYVLYESPNNFLGIKRWANGNWGPERQVTASNRLRGEIAVTTDGKIHIAYHDDVSDASKSDVFYDRYTSYDNFAREARVQLSQFPAFNADIQSDRNNRVHIVWEERTCGGCAERIVKYREVIGASVGGSVDLSDPEASHKGATVAADANSNVFVAWSINSERRIVERQRINGVWGAKPAISDGPVARSQEYGQSLRGSVNLMFLEADSTANLTAKFLARTGIVISDTTAPIITGATVPGSSASQRVNVSVQATDPQSGDQTVSGLARYEYSLNQVNWVLGAQTTSANASFSVDLANPAAGGSWAGGTRTIYFRVVDAAGNVSSAPFTARNLTFTPGAVTTRYAAEGFTGTGFDMYATLANPGASTIFVSIDFQYAAGATGPAGTLVEIAPGQRRTVKINDLAGANKSLALRFQSNATFFAERPMYFSNYGGKGINGGHVSSAAAAAPDWYFAEGYTGDGFDGYFTILNPGNETANVTITYYFTGGGQTTRTLSVAPGVRSTVNIHQTATGGNPGGLGPNETFSAKVSGNGRAIVVERVQYFSYGAGWTGGTATLGATSPNTTWYFAEGWTGAGFDQYVTIQNPNNTAGTATLTYFINGAAAQNRIVPLAANSRTTVRVHDAANSGNPGGLGRNLENSLRIVSTVPVVAERPMYFNYNGGPGMENVNGGHNAIGATNTIKQGETVFFAEGTTRPGFHQYLTFQNPNNSNASVTIRYLRGDGTTATRTFGIGAGQRATVSVHVGAGAGLGAGSNDSFDIATSVKVDVAGGEGLLVERPMYFRYQGTITGGHNAMPMRFE